MSTASNSLIYTEDGNVIDDKSSIDDYYDTNANETPALQLFNGTSIDQRITPPAPRFLQQRPSPTTNTGPLSFSDDGIGGAPSIVLNQTLPTELFLGREPPAYCQRHLPRCITTLGTLASQSNTFPNIETDSNPI